MRLPTLPTLSPVSRPPKSTLRPPANCPHSGPGHSLAQGLPPAPAPLPVVREAPGHTAPSSLVRPEGPTHPAPAATCFLWSECASLPRPTCRRQLTPVRHLAGCWEQPASLPSWLLPGTPSEGQAALTSAALGHAPRAPLLCQEGARPSGPGAFRCPRAEVRPKARSVLALAAASHLQPPSGTFPTAPFVPQCLCLPCCHSGMSDGPQSPLVPLPSVPLSGPGLSPSLIGGCASCPPRGAGVVLVRGDC